MSSTYEELIPIRILFPLRDIEELGIIKVSTMKKLIALGKIEYVKIGVKIFIVRNELIKYLQDNTIHSKDIDKL